MSILKKLIFYGAALPAVIFLSTACGSGGGEEDAVTDDTLTEIDAADTDLPDDPAVEPDEIGDTAGDSPPEGEEDGELDAAPDEIEDVDFNL